MSTKYQEWMFKKIYHHIKPHVTKTIKKKQKNKNRISRQSGEIKLKSSLWRNIIV